MVMYEDMQERLRIALDQLDTERTKRSVLERDVGDLEGMANQIKCEKEQLASRIVTYEDHVSIIKRKNKFLKRELAKAKKRSDECDILERDNESLVSKLRKKTGKLKRVAHYLDGHDFDAVAQENDTLRMTNEKAQIENANLTSKSAGLGRENELLKDKIAALEDALHDSNAFHSQVSSLTRQLADKDTETRLMQQKLGNMTAKYEECSRVVVDLQTKLLQGQAVEQHNVQLRQRINTFTTENRELHDRVQAQEDIKKRLGDVETTNKRLQSELEQSRAESERLKRQIGDAEQRVSAEHKRDVSDITRISNLTRENESLKADLRAFNAMRIERDQMTQDVKILEAKVARMKDAEKRNVDLSLRVDALTAQASDGAIRESRQAENITRLLSDRKELEKVRHRLLRIEDEVNERESREQQLMSQVNFYKAQISEHRAQINNYEEQVHGLRNELFRVREARKTTERDFRRLISDKRRADEDREVLSRRLLSEKKRSLRSDTKLRDMHHRVERYRSTLESYT